MPSVVWNKSWAGNLKHFSKGGLKGRYYGDQWGVPEENPHLAAVVEAHITPFISGDITTLEIGSGGGRWTQFLLPSAKVYCVDLNPEMFSALAERFPDADNMVFVATSGFDLPGVQRESIDFAFSFGTLVHCDRPIVEGYLASLNLALKAGARAHLQFSDKTKPEAAANPDFADTTPSMMMEMAEKAGFSVDVMDERLPHSAIVQLVKL